MRLLQAEQKEAARGTAGPLLSERSNEDMAIRQRSANSRGVQTKMAGVPSTVSTFHLRCLHALPWAQRTIADVGGGADGGGGGVVVVVVAVVVVEAVAGDGEDGRHVALLLVGDKKGSHYYSDDKYHG